MIAGKSMYLGAIAVLFGVISSVMHVVNDQNQNQAHAMPSRQEPLLKKEPRQAGNNEPGRVIICSGEECHIVRLRNKGRQIADPLSEDAWVRIALYMKRRGIPYQYATVTKYRPPWRWPLCQRRATFSCVRQI